MSTAKEMANRFVRDETEFHLGHLVTEQFHPQTERLSETAAHDPEAACSDLFAVDREALELLAEPRVLRATRELAREAFETVRAGGRIFCVGCGSTGRLSILLEILWRRAVGGDPQETGRRADAVCSIMAGGEYAFFRAVEGYEDFPQFGRRQLMEQGVSQKDLVVAISEGGETPFVIGAAHAGAEAGARTWFVYNNPDGVLRSLQRSREVLDAPGIRALCLATGPMAISGSTRMQATSVELAVVGTALQAANTALADGSSELDATVATGLEAGRRLGERFADAALVREVTHMALFEERCYRAGGQLTYLAGTLAPDILTDTTERPPTFSLPVFRPVDATRGDPSWAYLCLPTDESEAAWRELFGRAPRTVEWSGASIAAMLSERDQQFLKSFPKIDQDAVRRFDLSRRALSARLQSDHDRVVLVLDGRDRREAFVRALAETPELSAERLACAVFDGTFDGSTGLSRPMGVEPFVFRAPVGDGEVARRLFVKIVMNTVSTLTMCRMERVTGNCMTWVTTSNKKLFDRATRYVARLAGCEYEAACREVFAVADWLAGDSAQQGGDLAPVLLAALCSKDRCAPPEAARRLRDAQASGVRLLDRLVEEAPLPSV